MKRLKSIDIFRGICMGWMFLGHLLDWWLKAEYFSLKNFTHSILDPIGASGFLFISGVSIAISYRIWTWFVLMTAAFSLLITWPLFKLSKKTRIFICFSIWIINQFIYNFLSPHQGLTTLQGVFYHILYNDLSQDTLLNFFPFFLFGTVVGDVLYEINFNKKTTTKKK